MSSNDGTALRTIKILCKLMYHKQHKKMHWCNFPGGEGGVLPYGLDTSEYFITTSNLTQMR